MKTNIELPDLNRADYTPLYIQLSRILEEYIRVNQVKEGHTIPSENVLLSRYNVSRATIRQAVQHLESQDIVRRVRGKGTLVASPKRRDYVAGFQNLEDRLAELGFEPSNRILEYKTINPPWEWAKWLNLNPQDQALLIRRLKLADGRPLALEERILPLDIAQRFTKEDFKDQPCFNVLDREADLRIMRVIYFIRSFALTKYEAKKLDTNPRAPIIRRFGVYYNSSQRPVMFSNMTFLADKIEIRFEFHKEDDNWGIINLV